jgi:hypothetical protein
MATIDKEFQELCKKILTDGKEYENKNRGVKRLQIPSYTFRHEFKDGFPDDKKLILLVENFQNNSVDGAKWDPWKFGLATLIQDDLVQVGYCIRSYLVLRAA